jgi:DNA-directed RNA polymerase subunit RPC12/RpoP
MISDLKKAGKQDDVIGVCANCGKTVYESLWILDDSYNVYGGRCPYCKAINLLSMNHGLRGYTSQTMHLVLPTDEEKKANQLPADCPTSGPAGVPADRHGSRLGEISHRMREGMREK